MREARKVTDRNKSYQKGKLELRKRKGGPGIWTLRYRRYLSDGAVERVRESFSDTIECPTKTDAERSQKLKTLRDRINSIRTAVFFRDLACVYLSEHIEKNVRPHVQAGYKANLRYLDEKWGAKRLDQIITLGFEIKQWLEGELYSQRDPKKELARQTRQNIRNLFHHMISFAVLRGDLPYNPFGQKTLVVTRGGARPVERDFYITPEQFRFMQADQETSSHVRMMQLLAYCMGLRADEFLGLRWENVEFDGAEPVIHIKQGVVGKDIQLTKTSASEAKLPMCDLVGAALLCYLDENKPIEGWLFGSIRTGRPFHLGMLTTDHLRPALLRMAIKFKLKGVPQGIGFHAFRHTYRTLMDEVGSPLEVQQRLMRHSDPAMTQHYGKHGSAILRRMRQVHTDVTELAMTEVN